jgi:hypothetical protein
MKFGSYYIEQRDRPFVCETEFMNEAGETFVIKSVEEYEVIQFRSAPTSYCSYWLVGTLGHELELDHDELMELINNELLQEL